MSSRVSLFPAASHDIIRPVPNFVPYIWGDRFLDYEPESLDKQLVQEKEHGQLKEEVRNVFLGTENRSFCLLKLIDDTQRLGVAYQFKKEIKEALEKIYAAYLACCLDNDFTDLNYVSLCFRLLRQEGINISSDVFNKFKAENGMFKESLATDVEGLLSLYEAAHLSVRGETLLDEAILFSTAHLESFVKKESSILSRMVSRALYRPLRKSLVRVNAPHFISVYRALPSYNEILLRFAVLDFNLVQSMHKNELSDLTRWWRNVEFGKKFPFARDRMVECFYWSTGLGFEPDFYLLRKTIAKIIYLLTIIDDVYDSHGTVEELSLFTETTKMWSRGSATDVPEYMKVLYEIVLDFFEEIEMAMIDQKTSYRTSYSKEEMTVEIQQYFEEAKWRNEKTIPTMEEYLFVSTTSTAYAVMAITCLVCMDAEAVVEEDLQWLSKKPKILKAAEFICRVMDDVVSYKREKEVTNAVTSIECYTKQHGTTEEEAVRKLNVMVSDAWKDINQEFLEPTRGKCDILFPILYLAQVMDELYKEEDSYTNIGKAVREGISALFINPVSL